MEKVGLRMFILEEQGTSEHYHHIDRLLHIETMVRIEELQSGSLKLERWHSEIKEIGKQNFYVENSNSNHSDKVEKNTSILEITDIWNHTRKSLIWHFVILSLT